MKKTKQSPKSKAKSPLSEAQSETARGPADGVPARPTIDEADCPPPGPGEYKTVPRSAVRPDPNQPRKVFDEEKLHELAASITSQGILSPIVVRAMPAKLKIEEPDLTHDTWQAIDGSGAVVFEGTENLTKLFAGPDAEAFYQIVFGERRWRAAKIAGLNDVPVIIRELTEREVFIHQFIENQARENLTALDEAKAFAEQIAKRKETNPAFNAEKLADELKIARGTVYNRLTLTRLTQPVLDALTAGRIQTTVAGLIAMIPDPKQQEKLLKKITNEKDYQFPFSFRDVEEVIDDEYCKQLKDAPFDLKDTELVRRMCDGPGTELYGGSCTDCVARTGNMKAAFPHIKNVNVCTVPECFQKKCLAHFSDEAAAAERKGQKVFTAKEFKSVKKDYVAEDAYSNSSMYGYWKDLMGKHAPEPVLVVTEEGLKKVYPREAATEAAAKNGHKPAKQQTPEQKAKEEEKQKEAAATQARREEIVKSLAPMLLKQICKLKDSLAWGLASKMITSLDWPARELEPLLMDAAENKGTKAIVLGRCFADCEMSPVHHSGDWNEDNVKLWKLAGVDLMAEEKKRESAPAVLPLTKAQPQQKELLTVKQSKKAKMSPAARAKIAAAAKARWAKAKAKTAAR